MEVLKVGARFLRDVDHVRETWETKVLIFDRCSIHDAIHVRSIMRRVGSTKILPEHFGNAY